MPYKAEVLDEAAHRHARYYLSKLMKLKATYQSAPGRAVPQLRKMMPQVQQAHSWLLARLEVDLSAANLLLEMTTTGMGYIRMVVSPGEWERWIKIGGETALEIGRRADHLDFIIEQGIHAFRQGDLETARTFAETGEESATALPDPGKRAQCYYLQALVHQKQGEIRAAYAAVLRAQEDYEQVDDKVGIGKVRSFLAQAAIDALDYERAQQLLEQNILLWEEMGNLRQMAVEQYQLGVMFSNRLLSAKADDYLLAARQTFQKLADRRYEAYSLQILSSNAIERGTLEAALTYIEAAYGLFSEVNDQRGVAGSLNYIGRIHNKQGDYERAIVAHQRAADVARSIDYRYAFTDAHRSMCEIHLKTGNLAAARQGLCTAVTVGETSGNRLLMLAVLAAAVGVLAADERLRVAADVACTIQTATEAPLILKMLQPHIVTVNTDTGTPMSIEEANELIKKLYQ
jgi:tetratricopeptide (TPR) repeat protein